MDKLKVSEYLSVNEENGSIEIKKPEINMQYDASCFEAVALLLKARNSKLHVTLSFSPINWTGEFLNLTADQAHYMRFLYRLLRFTEEMEWCSLDDSSAAEVARFAQELARQKTIINNVPTSKAKHNPQKGVEHDLENRFVLDQGRYLSQLLSSQGDSTLDCIDHQLPNGLFAGDIANKTRIFPTGFFDLWGINEENEFCLFELKTGDNMKMGLLSELYFYAEYAAEFLLDQSRINPSATKLRGYSTLLKAVKNGCKKVNAYFLVGNKIHSEIAKNKEQILALLNSAHPQINYRFLMYDEGQI